MGLGKTIQTLTFLAALKVRRRATIVVFATHTHPAHTSGSPRATAVAAATLTVDARFAALSREDAGLPGPHLVVTPLAVLQNWANELKRFTPSLSFVKVSREYVARKDLIS